MKTATEVFENKIEKSWFDFDVDFKLRQQIILCMKEYAVGALQQYYMDCIYDPTPDGGQRETSIEISEWVEKNINPNPDNTVIWSLKEEKMYTKDEVIKLVQKMLKSMYDEQSDVWMSLNYKMFIDENL